MLDKFAKGERLNRKEGLKQIRDKSNKEKEKP